jgi:hypothetical protein
LQAGHGKHGFAVYICLEVIFSIERNKNMEMSIPLGKFDFNGLVQKTLDFAEDCLASPYFAIPWTVGQKSEPHYGKDEGDETYPDDIPLEADRDYYNEMVCEGKSLFFTFTASNVGEPVECADGKAYGNEGEDDGDEELGIGEGDSFGFLLKYQNGLITVSSASSFGGDCMRGPEIEKTEDCGIFERPMEKFINKFIKK